VFGSIIIIIIATAKAVTDLQNQEDHNKSINKDLAIEKAEPEHHMKHGKHIMNKSIESIYITYIFV